MWSKDLAKSAQQGTNLCYGWGDLPLEPHCVMIRLQEHHREIEKCLHEGQALLGDGDACQLKALGLLRWQLMRVLRAYQLFKHTEVFDPIIASADPTRVREAEKLKQRCLAMGDAYQDHVKRWTLTGPAHSWPDYRTETDEMIRRIRGHMVEEARAVETLLAGLRRTRQIFPSSSTTRA